MKKKMLSLLKEKIQTILIKNFFFRESYDVTVTNILFSKNFTEIYVYILFYKEDPKFISNLNKYSFFIKKKLINDLKLYNLKQIFFIYDDNTLKSIDVINILDKLKSE